MSDHPPATLPSTTGTKNSVANRSRVLLRERAPALATATRFLPNDQGRDLAIVYAFCWYVTSGHTVAVSDDDHAAWSRSAEATLSGDAYDNELTSAWLKVAARRQIPTELALSLIQGSRDSSGATRIEDDGELVRYCYRVAGLVAAMLVRVLGATDDRALPHAIDLGIAMQLTNVAVDVRKDARFGDVFLPHKRLALYGVTPDDVLAGNADDRAIGRVTYDVLELAERYYQSADQGMAFLSLRNRIALITGARLYRLQGKLLRRQNYSVDHSSVRPGPLRRLACLARSAMASLSAPFRNIGLYRNHNRWLHRRLRDLPGLPEEPASKLLASTEPGHS